MTPRMKSFLGTLLILNTVTSLWFTPSRFSLPSSISPIGSSKLKALLRDDLQDSGEDDTPCQNNEPDLDVLANLLGGAGIGKASGPVHHPLLDNDLTDLLPRAPEPAHKAKVRVVRISSHLPTLDLSPPKGLLESLDAPVRPRVRFINLDGPAEDEPDDSDIDVPNPFQPLQSLLDNIINKQKEVIDDSTEDDNDDEPISPHVVHVSGVLGPFPAQPSVDLDEEGSDPLSILGQRLSELTHLSAGMIQDDVEEEDQPNDDGLKVVRIRIQPIHRPEPDQITIHKVSVDSDSQGPNAIIRIGGSQPEGDSGNPFVVVHKSDDSNGLLPQNGVSAEDLAHLSDVGHPGIAAAIANNANAVQLHGIDPPTTHVQVSGPIPAGEDNHAHVVTETKKTPVSSQTHIVHNGKSLRVHHKKTHRIQKKHHVVFHKQNKRHRYRVKKVTVTMPLQAKYAQPQLYWQSGAQAQVQAQPFYWTYPSNGYGYSAYGWPGVIPQIQGLPIHYLNQPVATQPQTIKTTIAEAAPQADEHHMDKTIITTTADISQLKSEISKIEDELNKPHHKSAKKP